MCCLRARQSREEARLLASPTPDPNRPSLPAPFASWRMISDEVWDQVREAWFEAIPEQYRNTGEDRGPAEQAVVQRTGRADFAGRARSCRADADHCRHPCARQSVLVSLAWQKSAVVEELASGTRKSAC